MGRQIRAVQKAVAKITRGELSTRELLSVYLEQIDALEDRVGAWAYFNKESVLDQVEKLEEPAALGAGEGTPLRGIPIGVKDIFDTADMPTENGTSAQKGRQPLRDATVVKILRDAGAVIMGKTVTAELAVYTPGKTTNPHDSARTPGGSSSGSAAAVAAGMVPLAVGTQTNGSVIRPASYCGVVGFKPTCATISREGILKQAPSLDQVGVFAANVRDAALLAELLMARTDDSTPDSNQGEAFEIAPDDQLSGEDFHPKFGFVRSPAWDEATTATKRAILAFVERLGGNVVEIDLPPLCDSSIRCHRTIMLHEMALNYQTFYDDHRELISKTLLDMITEGRQIPHEAYLEARETARKITDVVDGILSPFDAVLTPATPSEAPIGLESTGSPVFCTIWSLCGVPSISLPVLKGEDHMPLGLQLVGARGTDKRLLEGSVWIERLCHSQKVY